MSIFDQFSDELTEEQIDRLNESGIAEAKIAVIEGWLSEQQFLTAAADSLELELVDLSTYSFDISLIQSFRSQDLFRFRVLPLEIRDEMLVVATANPFDIESIDEFSSLAGYPVEIMLACSRQIEESLTKFLGVGGGTVQELMAKEDGSESFEELDNNLIDEDSQSSSVVKLVNELLLEAISQRASDIHLEPDEYGLDVRYRIDGLLRVQPVPAQIHRFRSAIVSRLKIMAKLNIAEKRLPQDGRITLTIGGKELDVRVSIIPMLHGEGIVMRILDKSRADFNLAGLQFPKKVDQAWRSLIKRPHGMILVTGPTGSGKTSTLYSSLSEIRDPNTKIITVEDPVEYQLKGVSQIQVQSKIGLTFASGLRSILRHDPDVILIGEIRDSETATSAVQASLTGHTVLSTLHTNDACSAYTRLIDMGVDPYLVASTVEGVLAQRLLRKLCPDCKEVYEPASEEIPGDLHLSDGTPIFKAVGCRNCHGLGYSGRLPIFELIQTDRTIRRLCASESSASEIRDHALSIGMQTLRQSGWERVRQGCTTIDEVVRCCTTEEDEVVTTDSSPSSTAPSEKIVLQGM